jgi:hypothetical protein
VEPFHFGTGKELNQTPLNRQIVSHRAPYGINIKTAKKRLEDLRKEKIGF